MTDTFQSVLIGGAAGAVSAIITYFSTRAKIRLDLAADYDKKLQEARLEAYKELWAMLEPLARFGQNTPVTLAVIRQISDKTRTWYFQSGGIYLTERSRKPYFKWKGLLQPLLDDSNLAGKPDDPIPQPRLDSIVAAGSRLRTSLSDDIGTKRLTRL
ncbi:MAG TPA: hypothetical protein VL523_05440 [Terriglobia bacterium]|nr:hypothetical protein [Terriglobia bacterium]